VLEKLITKTKEMRSIKRIGTLANFMGDPPLLRWQGNKAFLRGLVINARAENMPGKKYLI